MIQDKIIADIKTARVEGNTIKKDLLGVVLSEIVRYNKIVSDEEAIKTIKKCIENAKLCNNLHEIPILEIYLPKSMSDQEMWDILIPAFNSIDKSNFGELMKKAKELLGNNFDGKRVSAIIKIL